MPEFENNTPITDVREVMELLSPKGGRWAGAELHDGYYTNYAYVEVIWEQSPPRGSSSEYFMVDKGCAKAVKEQGFVSGTPAMGYTDEHRLTLNPRGTDQLLRLSEQDKQAAHDLLVPGEHGWSSQFNFRGAHTLHRGEPKDWKDGHLFENPLGQFFMVLLKDKQVVMVDKNRNPI